jgi:flavin reductase (DIM6/NTAB) family NADH-FMN oxidoreductase RutF
MSKIKLKPGIVNFPMPMTLVGVNVNGKTNFMPAAWVSMVSYAPPKIAVTLGEHHYTNKGIKAYGVFSVNFPSVEHMKPVDYCGLVTGAKVDKAGVFPVFYGTSENAPMVENFKLNVECKLDKIVVNGRNETFIGDIVSIYADETVLSDGKVDLDKLAPLLLGQITQEYRSLGEKVGPAWKIGKE